MHFHQSSQPFTKHASLFNFNDEKLSLLNQKFISYDEQLESITKLVILLQNFSEQ